MPPDATSGWSLSRWLEWLESGPRGGIEMGLDRVRQVSDRLAIPHAPTLTVAGTNGKGTCAHFAARLLQAAGLRTGLYTSPHLVDFRERVLIDGVPASEAELLSALQAVEAARQDVVLTYFEHVTLAALWLFASAGVAVRVLEVGLGGRLDAVNIVDADVAVITSIGLDHIDWLGDSRDAIGAEKAGVARGGRPLILAEQDPPDGLTAALNRIDAMVIGVGSAATVESVAGKWTYQDDELHMTGLPLPRQHSAATLRNVAAAMRAVRCMGVRAEMIETQARALLPDFGLAGRLDHRGNIILDVAHNAEAAAELARHLMHSRVGQGHDRLLLGMLSDKPVEAVVAALADCVSEIHLAGLPGARGLSTTELARRVRQTVPTMKVISHSDVSSALAACRGLSRGEDRIVVTGSFLTVAAAMHELSMSPHDA
jgi:dihydrofolate synthase/folylpolyglutamate synthase